MSQVPFSAAEQAFHAGNLDRAFQLCAAYLKQDPKHAGGTLLTGLIFARRRQPHEAVKWMEAALALSPNDYVAIICLPDLLRSVGRLDDAIVIGQKGHALWPENDDILVSLSRAYLEKRDLVQAAACLAKAIDIDPKKAPNHRRLGIAYEMLGRDEEAAAEFRKAIEFDVPGAQENYVRLGNLYLGHGNFAQAIELCEQALQLIPNSAQLRLLLAQALRGVRENEAAHESLRQAIALDPEIVLSAALWLNEDGEFEGAARLFETSIERRPKQGVAYFGLVKGRKVGGADAALLQKMETLLKDPALPPKERAALFYGLGKAANDLKEYERAMSFFEEGNRLNYDIFLAGKPYDTEQLDRNRAKILSMFSAEFMASHRHLGSDSKVPIFIIGMIRSGTTLVEQILASHPDVGGAGEQRFWVNTMPKLVDLDAGTLDEKQFVEARDRYLRVLRSFQPASERITDKMPLNFYCAGPIHLAYPNAPIIHIQRHPVDTALSIYMTDLAKPPDFAHDRKNIVAEYRNYQAMMRHWRSVIPSDRLLEVRYEDLVSDQEYWTRQMLEFCGLPWDERCLEFYANERQVSTPSMWQVRQPIYRSSVERWRNYEPWLGDFTDLLEDI